MSPSAPAKVETVGACAQGVLVSDHRLLCYSIESGTSSAVHQLIYRLQPLILTILRAGECVRICLLWKRISSRVYVELNVNSPAGDARTRVGSVRMHLMSSLLS